MIYLFFDTETTGLPKKWSAPLSDVANWPRIVQLSFIVCYRDDKGNEVMPTEEFDFIIKPEGFKIPKESSAIHGITDEIALKDGKDLNECLQSLRQFINMADLIVGHNIDFDKSIVGAEYYRLGLGESFEKRIKEKKLFCTMKEATELCGITGTHAGQNKWPRLTELYRKLFDKDFDGAHNSMNDVRATMECYFELEKQL